MKPDEVSSKERWGRKVKVRSLLSCNRSQVQGSTFRVKDKEGIEDLKSS